MACISVYSGGKGRGKHLRTSFIPSARWYQHHGNQILFQYWTSWFKSKSKPLYLALTQMSQVQKRTARLGWTKGRFLEHCWLDKTRHLICQSYSRNWTPCDEGKLEFPKFLKYFQLLQNVVKYHSHFGHSTFEWSPDITVKYIHTKKDQLMFALVTAVESQTTVETWLSFAWDCKSRS